MASDIDGYRDAAGGHAVLVPPADRWALAEALAGVLAGRLAVSGAIGGRSDRAPDRWVAAAAERADQWSMERLARWYEGLYRSAMVGSPAVSGRTLLGP